MTYGGALSFLRRKYSRDVFDHGDKVGYQHRYLYILATYTGL
jgi:hypothetical protein